MELLVPASDHGFRPRLMRVETTEHSEVEKPEQLRPQVLPTAIVGRTVSLKLALNEFPFGVSREQAYTESRRHMFQ